MKTEIKAAPPNGTDQPPVIYEDPLNIERSPFNREVTWDPALGELTDSIRSIGLIEPLVARWNPRLKPGETVPIGRLGRTAKPIYQLISGERRWRAAQLAGLTKIPVIIRHADDKEVLELQTIENDQREDLSPIDRAKNYARLVAQYEKEGLPRTKAIEKLCERIGRKKSNVYEILTLVEKLAKPVQKVAATGRLPASHAALIATIKLPELQEQLCKVIAPDKPGSKETEQLERKLGLWCEERDEKGTLSFRETKDLVEEHRKLEAAGEKWLELAEKHRAAGGVVMEEKDRSKYLKHYGSAQPGFVLGTDHTSGYGGVYRSYKELMGKHAPKPILGHNDRYQALEVFNREEVRGAIEKNGHKWTQGGTAKERAEDRARREREEQMQPVITAAKAELLRVAGKARPRFPWKMLIDYLKEGSIGGTFLKPKPAELTDRKIGGVLVRFLVEDRGELWSSDRTHGWDKDFLALCKHYRVNLARIEKELAPAKPRNKKPMKSKKGKK